MSIDGSDFESEAGSASGKGRMKLAVLAAVVLLGGVLFWQFRDQLSLASLAASEQQLQQYREDKPLLIYAIAFLIYAGVTGFSIPGATGLTLLCAWFFGFWRGVLLVSFASTTGATIAFLLSRYILGSTIQEKFADRLTNFNQALEREGPFFLFTLRLIPLVPFFVINVVMGLTPIKAKTFWWISQLGMLPGTAAYVYAGSSVPGLQLLADEGVAAAFSPRQLTQLFFAFAILGLLPFVIRILLKLIRRALGKSGSLTTKAHHS